MPQLSSLIDLPSRPLISIVGAGGKTTTMYTLGAELAQRGKRVITTTTTNIFPPQASETDELIIAAETPTLLGMIRDGWKHYQRLTVAAATNEVGKLVGLQVEQPYELLRGSGADAVIVEADGARHHMIKAPAEHEPVIPGHTNIVLLMMSAEAINQALSPEIAHRPERIAAIVGMNEGEVLTPARIAKLMLHEQGGLKNIPESAELYLLITHASGEQQAAIEEVAILVQPSPRVADVYYSPRPMEWHAM